MFWRVVVVVCLIDDKRQPARVLPPTSLAAGRRSYDSRFNSTRIISAAYWYRAAGPGWLLAEVACRDCRRLCRPAQSKRSVVFLFIRPTTLIAAFMSLVTGVEQTRTPAKQRNNCPMVITPASRCKLRRVLQLIAWNRALMQWCSEPIGTKSHQNMKTFVIIMIQS